MANNLSLCIAMVKLRRSSADENLWKQVRYRLEYFGCPRAGRS